MHAYCLVQFVLRVDLQCRLSVPQDGSSETLCICIKVRGFIRLLKVQRLKLDTQSVRQGEDTISGFRKSERGKNLFKLLSV